MATGQTLCFFTPRMNEGVTTGQDGATPGTRGGRSVLQFSDVVGANGTEERANFIGLMPRNYGGGGITVYLHWDAVATTGTVGWLIALERMSDATTDMDGSGLAADQTVTAATVSGTSGIISVTNVAITNGANMDSIAVGDSFRLRIKRDVSVDTAVGFANLYMVEIKET